jgi:hypothetical protein
MTLNREIQGCTFLPVSLSNPVGKSGASFGAQQAKCRFATVNKQEGRPLRREKMRSTKSKQAYMGPYLPFVDLIDDHVADSVQGWIFNQPSQYHSRGTKQKTGIGSSSRFHANLIPHQALANGDIAQFLGHPFCHGNSRDTPGLSAENRRDIAGSLCQCLLQNVRGTLSGFTTPYKIAIKMSRIVSGQA